MASLLSKVSTWIDEARSETADPSSQTFTDFGSTSKVWTGTNVVAKFVVLGFGPDDIRNKYLQPFEELCADIQRARSEEEAIKNQGENKMPTLHSSTLGLLEEFFTIMKNMYDHDQKFRDDFRVALVKTQENTKSKPAAKKGDWLTKGRPSFGSVLDY